jgi:hypothetical protein
MAISPCSFILLAVGGLMMLILVPNGPENKLKESSCQLRWHIKKSKHAAALFWSHVELYAFWAFTPLILKPIMTYIQKQYLTCFIFSDNRAMD